MKAPTFSRICAHSGSSFGLEHHPLQCRGYRLSSMNSASAPHREVLPFRAALVGAAAACARPTPRVPKTGSVRRQLIAERIQHAVLAVASADVLQAEHADERSRPCRRAPSRPRACQSVRAKMPATKPQGGNSARPVLLQRIRRDDPREVERGVDRVVAGREIDTSGCVGGVSVGGFGQSAIRKCAAIAAEYACSVESVGGVDEAGHAQQVEQIHAVQQGTRPPCR